MKEITFKEYEGKILRLIYPSLLKIKAESPQWWALARAKKANVSIEVNPIQSRVEAFARMIRNPDFTKVSGAFIEREGDFSTAKGIKGYERVARMSETMAWAIDGKFREREAMIIQMWTLKSEWHDGRPWRELLDSIEIIGG